NSASADSKSRSRSETRALACNHFGSLGLVFEYSRIRSSARFRDSEPLTLDVDSPRSTCIGRYFAPANRNSIVRCSAYACTISCSAASTLECLKAFSMNSTQKTSATVPRTQRNTKLVPISGLLRGFMGLLLAFVKERFRICESGYG